MAETWGCGTHTTSWQASGRWSVPSITGKQRGDPGLHHRERRHTPMGMTMTQKTCCPLRPGARQGGTADRGEPDIVLGNDITRWPSTSLKGGLAMFRQDPGEHRSGSLRPQQGHQERPAVQAVPGVLLRHGIVNFFDVGKMGVEHALLPSRARHRRDCIIGADTPAPTARWGLPPAWAPRTMAAGRPPARRGSRCPPPSAWS